MDTSSRTNSSDSDSDIEFPLYKPSPSSDTLQCLPQEAKQAIRLLVLAQKHDFKAPLPRSISEQLQIVIGFLEALEHQVKTGGSLCDASQGALLELIDPLCLSALFRCRGLAVAEDRRSDGVVNLADIALMRLVVLNNILLGAISEGEQYELVSSVCRQKELDLQRAIKQLPETWELLPTALSRTTYSPAAQWCALHLLFLAYACTPDATIKLSLRSVQTLLGHLYRLIENSQQGQSLLSRDGNTYQTTTAAALFLYLFWRLYQRYHEGETDAPPASFRPRSFGYLLELIVFVMDFEDCACRPRPALTPPQRLLLSGQFVPWTWSVWSDGRAAGAEYIVCLTSNWIFHHAFDSDPPASTHPLAPKQGTESTTKLDPAPSKAVLSLTQEMATPDSDSKVEEYLVVVKESCCMLLSLAQLPGPGLESLTENCLGSLLSLYLALKDSPKELDIKEVIIELFTLISTTSLRAGIESLSSNGTKSRLFSKVDRAILHYQRLLVAIKPGDDVTPECYFRAPTLFLCFLCTIWQARKDYIGLLDGIPFLGVVIKTLLAHADGTAPYYKAMRAAALVAIAACRNEQSFHDYVGKRELRELSFSVVGNSHDLTTACAYAYYLLLRETPLKSQLLACLAWDYFRNSLTTIMAGTSYLEGEECTALLASTSICLALLKLVLAHGDTLTAALRSPWTISLCKTLRCIIESTAAHPTFAGALKKRLTVPGKQLLDAISSRSSDPTKQTSGDDMPPFQPQVSFVRQSHGGLQVLVITKLNA
ncbi:hypothetical protein BKA70DRAFT_1418016 [Coprinopsis sp. MPI-PUGE-AT-0042]|nr:hypothetical protein BKA70DRAFT_1418016 [Coprinopsis sp. MPI-PUGE-AT-0042]